MNDTITPQEKEINLEFRIAQLRKLREIIKAKEEEHKKEMEKWEAPRRKLEGALMQWLLEHSVKTVNTKSGNITWVDNVTYPIEDVIAFQGFVIENRAWEMLDWKANKTAVTDYRKENSDLLPPGLKENPHPHLRVSGPAGKKTPAKRTGFELDTPEEE